MIGLHFLFAVQENVGRRAYETSPRRFFFVLLLEQNEDQRRVVLKIIGLKAAGQLGRLF